MNRWILYNLAIGFAVYWLSNLILWLPWSVSPWLGMTLMLTVSPIIWAFSTFLCLRTYPKNRLINGAVINGLIFLSIAVITDYFFFGLIRNAMDELYHPTTLYGYAFLVCLPFLVVLGFSKRIENNKKEIQNADFIRATTIGAVCLGILLLIIALE